MNCPTCGKKHSKSIHDAVVCICGTRIEEKPGEWPRWAKLIAKRRTGDERGVGDTVYRYSQKVGGERFKQMAEWLGMPCGCTARQERWNRLYPYGDSQ